MKNDDILRQVGLPTSEDKEEMAKRQIDALIFGTSISLVNPPEIRNIPLKDFFAAHKGQPTK